MWPSARDNQNRIESQGEIAQTGMSLQEGIGGTPDPHSLVAADRFARFGQAGACLYLHQRENAAAPRHKIDFAQCGSEIACQDSVTLESEPPGSQGFRPAPEDPSGAASFPAHGLLSASLRSAKARA